MAAIVLVVGGLGLAWWFGRAPDPGAPEGNIKPLFSSVEGETLSKKNFNGSIFESIRPAVPDAKPVHVVLTYVHGISCHSPDYSAPFQFRLAGAMGLSRERDTKTGVPMVEVTELTPDGPVKTSIPDYLSAEDVGSWDIDTPPSAVKSRFQERLAGKQIPPSFQRRCSHPEKGELLPPLKHSRFSIRHFSSESGDRLSVIEVLWSPLSELQKLLKVGEDLNLDVAGLRRRTIWSEPSAVAARADVDKRAYGNQMLKSSIINGAIADAIFYLGDGGPDIRTTVMAGLNAAIALREASRKEAIRRTNLVVVTESLGSRIVFDTLREAPDRIGAEFNDALSLLAAKPRVIMFANQLPLIDIATQTRRALDIVSDQAIRDQVKNLSARMNVLSNAAAVSGIEGSPMDKAQSVDGPSWAACAASNDQYVRLVSELMTTRLAPQIAGKTAVDVSDAIQDALARPMAPLSALLRAYAPDAAQPAKLDILQDFAGRAMAILMFSPGGLGYAKCQQQIVQAQARVRDFYQKEISAIEADPKRHLGHKINMPDALREEERLLKTAQDQRREQILDTDAITNVRSGSVFALLYTELTYLIKRCKAAPQDPVCSAASVETRLAKVASMVPRIEVLAFSDPNDLLSYRVTDEQYRSETFAFMNVPVRLAAPVLPAGGPMGGFTPPMEAHTNHKFDNRILAYLVCGWDKSAGRTYATLNGRPCPLQIAPKR
jgi:hypothetical protein